MIDGGLDNGRGGGNQEFEETRPAVSRTGAAPHRGDANYWNKFFGALPAKYEPPLDSKNCRAIWVAHAENAGVDVSSSNLMN